MHGWLGQTQRTLLPAAQQHGQAACPRRQRCNTATNYTRFLLVLHATDSNERSHPDLTRILMPEDWEGFPLRKDFDQGSIPVQFSTDFAVKP